MHHRRYSFLPTALVTALLLAAFACAKEPGTVERKSESTTRTTHGEVKTTQESKQVGNTLEAKTVGSHVRLTEQTGDDKGRRVTVKIEG